MNLITAERTKYLSDTAYRRNNHPETTHGFVIVCICIQTDGLNAQWFRHSTRWISNAIPLIDIKFCATTQGVTVTAMEAPSTPPNRKLTTIFSIYWWEQWKMNGTVSLCVILLSSAWCMFSVCGTCVSLSLASDVYSDFRHSILMWTFFCKRFSHTSRHFLRMSLFCLLLLIFTRAIGESENHNDMRRPFFMISKVPSYVWHVCNVVNFRICPLSPRCAQRNALLLQCLHLFIVCNFEYASVVPPTRHVYIASQWPLRGGGDKYEYWIPFTMAEGAAATTTSPTQRDIARQIAYAINFYIIIIYILCFRYFPVCVSLRPCASIIIIISPSFRQLPCVSRAAHHVHMKRALQYAFLINLKSMYLDDVARQQK